MYAVKEQLFNSLFIFAWYGVPIADKALIYQLVLQFTILVRKMITQTQAC